MCVRAELFRSIGIFVWKKMRVPCLVSALARHCVYRSAALPNAKRPRQVTGALDVDDIEQVIPPVAPLASSPRHDPFAILLPSSPQFGDEKGKGRRRKGYTALDQPNDARSTSMLSPVDEAMTKPPTTNHQSPVTSLSATDATHVLSCGISLCSFDRANELVYREAACRQHSHSTAKL